ncbi:MAG: zinc-dependent metalloprotease [Chitinophagaceae bacterium]
MKNHKLILTGIALLLLAQTAFSQAICAFDNMHAKLIKTDSLYRKSVLANETKIKEYIRMHPVGTLSGTSRGSSVNVTLYTIPVVVHVVHTGGAIGTIYNPTDAQITGAINYLNQVYNGTYPGTEGVGDIQIQFAMATRDTSCNAFTGIDRINGSSLTNYVSNGVNSSTSGGVTDLALKNFDRWDPANYYNIWVVNKIDAKDGTTGQFVAGYAYFAQGVSPLYDGTVMLATQMAAGQKTLPHEIGHALNLYHPFEGSSDATMCPSNADCTSDGDKVCDTDPVSQNLTAGIYDFTCRSGTNTVCGGTYSINTEKNYMNYTSCFTLFTAGQKARMMAALSLPGRASLVGSSAGGSYPLASYTAPVAASCTPVSNSAGLSGYYAGIMNVVVASKSFPSGATADDGGYNNKTNKCLYLIQLQKNNTYTFSASLLAANREQLRAWIDYNNDGVFSNATEQIYYSADIVGPGMGNQANVSVSFTVPATALSSTVLRMRVIDEVSTVYGAGFTIGNACYNPTYGQAEDYPIYLSALLPVKFDYFRGTKKNNDAFLSWKTSFEQNTKEFQVEKSVDGVVFDMIGTVPASNMASGSDYSFTDKNITAANNYYRLKQVDQDLKTTLSQTVIIKAASDGKSKLSVIKNPFDNQLDIVLSGMPAGNTTCNLFDMAGRKILSRNYKAADGQLVHIDVTGVGLKAGMYMLQVHTGKELLTAKVIKQ